MKVGDRVKYRKNGVVSDGLVLRVGISQPGAAHPTVDIVFVHPERLVHIGSANWRAAIDRVVEVPSLYDNSESAHHYYLNADIETDFEFLKKELAELADAKEVSPEAGGVEGQAEPEDKQDYAQAQEQAQDEEKV